MREIRIKNGIENLAKLVSEEYKVVFCLCEAELNLLKKESIRFDYDFQMKMMFLINTKWGTSEVELVLQSTNHGYIIKTLSVCGFPIYRKPTKLICDIWMITFKEDE